MVIPNYRIIHISDLHLGASHATTYAGSLAVAGAHGSGIQAPISELIHEYLEAADAVPDRTIVVCSGDLATCDQLKEFTEAGRFLRALTSRNRIPRDHIILVPGNHDVYWPDRDRNDPSRVLNLFTRRFRSFRNPMRADGPCYCYPRHGLLIYCLNSCQLCGAMEGIPEVDNVLRGLRGARRHQEAIRRLLRIDPGFIGRTQLAVIHTTVEHALATIPQEERRKFLRIAVLHHHVTEVNPDLRRFASVVDAPQLKQRLHEAGFHIILHGHKHSSHYCSDSTFKDCSNASLSVLGAGTMGGHLQAGHYYSFNVLDVTNRQSLPQQVSVRRIKYDASGSQVNPPVTWKVQLPRAQSLARDKSRESLRRALSPILPGAFADAMADLNRDYRLCNDVVAERYNVHYLLHFPPSRTVGWYEATHTLRVRSIASEPINHFWLPLSGSHQVPDDKLRMKARYHLAGSRWHRSPTPSVEQDKGLVKLVMLTFGRGPLAPNGVAHIELTHRWPDCVDSQEDEWGLESLFFRGGIQRMSLTCVLHGNLRFTGAHAFAVQYDTNDETYERGAEQILHPSRDRRAVCWECMTGADRQALYCIQTQMAEP